MTATFEKNGGGDLDSVIEVALKIKNTCKGHTNEDVIPGLIAHIGFRFGSCTSAERRYTLNLLMELFTELTYADIEKGTFTVPKH